MNNVQDIVQKLWGLCNILKDDGVTYHQYVNELTYLLFLKMAEETGLESGIPEDCRWAALRDLSPATRVPAYKGILLKLSQTSNSLIQAIFTEANSIIKSLSR